MLVNLSISPILKNLAHYLNFSQSEIYEVNPSIDILDLIKSWLNIVDNESEVLVYMQIKFLPPLILKV